MEKFLVVILLSLIALGAFTRLAGKFGWFSGKHRMPAGEEDGTEAETDEEASSECCGQHLVCHKDAKLMAQTDIVYYDDEELDAYCKMSPESYDDKALALFSDVFYTLQPEDVAGWLNSLRLREIELPMELRDEALMIVTERRNTAQ